MMLNLFAAGVPSNAPELEDANRDEVYRRYVERAFIEHEICSDVREQTLRGLSWLAKTMRRRDATDLWLERLQTEWLEGPSDRRLARGLGVATIALGLSAIQLAPAVAVGLDWTSTLMVLGLSIPIVFVLLGSLTIRPVESLRWSWRRSLRFISLTIAIGAVVGSLMGLRHEFAFNLAVCTCLGVLGGLAMWTEPSDRGARVRPNEGIVQSLRSAVRVAVPHAILGSVVFGVAVLPVMATLTNRSPHLPSNLELSVRMGSVIASLLLMFYGAAAAILHGAIRIVLAARTPLPLDLVSFLEHAADLGLMRRIGGGYIFFHRTLLDYFARGPDRAEPRRELSRG